jgi:hypothetical protein
MFGGLASQCRKFAAEIETREREEAAVRSPFVPIKQSGIFR